MPADAFQLIEISTFARSGSARQAEEKRQKHDAGRAIVKILPPSSDRLK
jgi:hypothetical protein